MGVFFDLVKQFPPRGDGAARNALELATLVVVPVQPSPADLWATEVSLGLASGLGVPALMVQNRVPPRARIAQEALAVLTGLDAPLARAQLGNRVAFAESLAHGSTALEARPGGPAAEEVRTLADEVLERAGSDRPGRVVIS